MKAVVFDMDGVIFDSENLVIQMWKVVAEKYHIPDVERVCRECFGINATATRKIFLEHYGEDFPYDEYKQEMSALFHQNAEGGKLPQKPGITELLEYLKEHRIKTAVASSTREEIVRKELEEGGLLPFFDEIVCGDMVGKSKPEPDIYLEALRRIDVKPEDAWAIEDSYNGIRSASRAGMHPVMVPDLAEPTEEMENLADHILPSLSEVKTLFQRTECEKLKELILAKDAAAWTHNGKFHADDVFSAALLLYLNPEIRIFRGNRVPDDFGGIVFDIGRGRYDHHQKDSRIRSNGVPYAAFGLLWETLGADILGEDLAEKFDEAFVQPLDNNDNTGEKNELASLIGSFNPAWDAEDENDTAFFQAVGVAGMILDHKFERYLGNERADRRIDLILEAREKDNDHDDRILVLPEFIPCQKKLSETEIAFVIFPSNRGGYCVQPQKKEYSMNYKCSFLAEWLGLEGDELIKATGLQSASFCHKGGFLMTTGTLEDAIEAGRISLRMFSEEPVIVSLGGDSEVNRLLHQIPHMENAVIHNLEFQNIPDLTMDGIYGEVTMEKLQWKASIKEQVKRIIRYKPEAVFVDGTVFQTYPIVHALRKKHIPVLTLAEKNGEKIIIRIPSGS